MTKDQKKRVMKELRAYKRMLHLVWCHEAHQLPASQIAKQQDRVRDLLRDLAE